MLPLLSSLSCRVRHAMLMFSPLLIFRLSYADISLMLSAFASFRRFAIFALMIFFRCLFFLFDAFAISFAIESTLGITLTLLFRHDYFVIFIFHAAADTLLILLLLLLLSSYAMPPFAMIMPCPADFQLPAAFIFFLSLSSIFRFSLFRCCHYATHCRFDCRQLRHWFSRFRCRHDTVAGFSCHAFLMAIIIRRHADSLSARHTLMLSLLIIAAFAIFFRHAAIDTLFFRCWLLSCFLFAFRRAAFFCFSPPLLFLFFFFIAALRFRFDDYALLSLLMILLRAFLRQLLFSFSFLSPPHCRCCFFDGTMLSFRFFAFRYAFAIAFRRRYYCRHTLWLLLFAISCCLFFSAIFRHDFRLLRLFAAIGVSPCWLLSILHVSCYFMLLMPRHYCFSHADATIEHTPLFSPLIIYYFRWFPSFADFFADADDISTFSPLSAAFAAITLRASRRFLSLFSFAAVTLIFCRHDVTVWRPYITSCHAALPCYMMISFFHDLRCRCHFASFHMIFCFRLSPMLLSRFTPLMPLLLLPLTLSLSFFRFRRRHFSMLFFFLRFHFSLFAIVFRFIFAVTLLITLLCFDYFSPLFSPLMMPAMLIAAGFHYCFLRFRFSLFVDFHFAFLFFSRCYAPMLADCCCRQLCHLLRFASHVAWCCWLWLRRFRFLFALFTPLFSPLSSSLLMLIFSPLIFDYAAITLIFRWCFRFRFFIFFSPCCFCRFSLPFSPYRWYFAFFRRWYAFHCWYCRFSISRYSPFWCADFADFRYAFRHFLFCWLFDAAFFSLLLRASWCCLMLPLMPVAADIILFRRCQLLSLMPPCCRHELFATCFAFAFQPPPRLMPRQLSPFFDFLLRRFDADYVFHCFSFSLSRCCFFVIILRHAAATIFRCTYACPLSILMLPPALIFRVRHDMPAAADLFSMPLMLFSWCHAAELLSFRCRHWLPDADFFAAYCCMMPLIFSPMLSCLRWHAADFRHFLIFSLMPLPCCFRFRFAALLPLLPYASYFRHFSLFLIRRMLDAAFRCRHTLFSLLPCWYLRHA